MKRFAPRLLLWFVSAALLHAAPREQEWRQVEEQAREEKPETVIALLTEIEAAARAERAWPEAVKALAFRLRLEAAQESDDLSLTRMDEAIPKAPPEMRPILTALQATFFSRYFSNHRWELMERTTVAGGTGTDITAWDLKRLLAETDARFQDALENAAVLKASPVTQWNGLLEAGGFPDSYQPTLYDFVARQALQFYTAAGQEAAEVRAENAFEFAPDSPALGTMAEFLAWKPGQGSAPKLRAVWLYQSLLAFHKEDPDPGARVLLDIERLRWAAGTATGQGAAARQLTQFRALAAQNAVHESSLLATSAAADLLIKQKKPAEAHALLTQAAAAHPKSLFAATCRNQLKQIEEKELSAATELLWNTSGPEIHFTCRNLEKIYFRLILVSKDPDPTLLDLTDDEDRVAKLLRKRPARTWGFDLGKTGDFLEKTHHVPAPVDVKPGFYLLAVSGNADFTKRRNQISFAPVLVSSLALINRVRDGEGDNIAVDAWVMDANTGDPVPGAEVSVWMEDEKTEKLAPQKTVLSDANGFATIAGEWDSGSVVFAVSSGNSAVSPTLNSSGNVQRDETDKNASTYFFTDRALYRPGQSIQFKGIHVRHDTSKSDYRTLAGVKRTVTLKDANNREIAKQEVVTNAFGSFSGTFTAPQNGITGEMTVRDGYDYAQFRVEEYKRPRFKVEVLPPAVPPKLGEQVTVSVKATGYTGASVDGAKVVWHVKREADWAPWVRNAWWFQSHSREKEIARGEATTGADGTAEIRFTAVPDNSVDEKTDPWFRYTVHADITDTAGETRSEDGSVRIGYTAMKASVDVEEWQTVKKPVAFTVNTTTLDDKPLKASGKLIVHRLVQPEKVYRPQLSDEYEDGGGTFKDLSDPETWDAGEVVQREDVSTNEKGEATLPIKLAAGAWRAIFESKDRAGKKITAQTLVLVVDPASEKFPVKIPFWAAARSLELKPGDDLSALWGSGYDRARAFIQIEHRGKVVQSFWSDAARSQQSVDFKVKEDHRGGFSVHIFQMRENRLVTHSIPVSVPWTNKELSLKWEHLTSKLEPGARDTWTLSIVGPDKEKSAAEMTAVLYDASLDAISKHRWDPAFDCFREEESWFQPGFYNKLVDFEEALNEWGEDGEAVNHSLRTWPFSLGGRPDLSGLEGLSGVAASRGLRLGSDGISGNAIDALIAGGSGRASYSVGGVGASPPAPTMAMEEVYDVSRGRPAFASRASRTKPDEAAPETRAITARKNMQETAFFLPLLPAGDDGTVKLEFTMPEAVTTWRFMGFAHDKNLRAGYLEGETITARDLMVQPNPPRFLREGDTVEFTVKITNQSDTPQHGTARLNMFDAATLMPADAALGLTAPEQPFEVPAKESRTVAWRLTIPDGQGFLTWKATAGTDKMSDGEEGWLPVLSRRVLLTESLPLSMSKAGDREYTFQKLKDSAASQTLRHQSLTVQMVSQPSWYAVMALPYLMEFPHECSEQTFNRLYANALAQHIAGHDPKIRRTFDLWREAQPDALKSPLLKNQELKSLLIEETPWLRDAANETEQRRNVGLLFDANRLDSETDRVLAQLDDLKSGDGYWPWFPGGPANEFITLYIVAGFGKLAHLGVKIKTDSAVEALDWLNDWLDSEHKAALKADAKRRDGRTGDHFDSSIALYLYARSFYLEQRPVQEEEKAALGYFLTQARSNWTNKCRMAQAHAAMGLLRFGDRPAAARILASLKERSVMKEDLGRYWPEANEGWRWDAAPIESQALMIEAFREIARDAETAGECAHWLLKQKQTQAWPTTKATADACYALLLGGTDKLSSDALVSVSLGGAEVKPEKVEAGTGFFAKTFAPGEITPDMGAVKLVKTDKGVAWGSVHWRYLEDISKITPHEGTPLKITKTLFTEVNGAAGPELRPVQGKVKVGDKLVVRLELRTDRDMEFVHLKDQRASSVEPVNVLSGYKWQDGLGYFESTRDTASHFFFDSLPKGTYVFEYSARVQLRGACQTGVAELQCMYAPEFNSHSASTVLEVE